MRLERILPFAVLGHWPAAADGSGLPSPGLRGRGSVPALPDRRPFGFGAAATGGGVADESNTYVVDNMMDLRSVLKMDTPRTVYVRGEIRGSQINETFSGDCQYYIDSSGVPGFNFTLYVMALNATYTDAVKAAVAAGEPFEGRNATEYLALLNRQNGWRGTAQNVQKSWEAIDAQGNLTLIGMDSTASLNGVSLIFNSRSNIIIRNLRLSSPRDCFPAPETYPSSWNARYDAVAFVTTTTAWLDGNVFADAAGGPVAPDDFLWGWRVDRYDGLFDAEDGSDDVTFSHNVVANHHKSLLWGGGEKEGPRDVGRMHFTVFANHFANSSSRNPLMRFGTFYVANNVFSNYANKPPLYSASSGAEERGGDLASIAAAAAAAETPYLPDFQYNLGIYNLSSVLVSGNYFDQTGAYPSDRSRIFTFQNLATPSHPARFCSPPDSSSSSSSSSSPSSSSALASLARPRSALNGAPLNLTADVLDAFAYYLGAKTDSVEGGLAVGCAAFEGQDMPVRFETPEDVFAYVVRNAGQTD
ncbi:putative polysaccharide lyase family 1 protein [Rosellinia necatrix]|uniref:Putative polysaccharide lyase family 1 protein n=1 Tax=Rosellinia necatrix TaxID=77044 RepID=A0A1W2TKS3_ROSNE|nr:putative polysaccharide lyase family 1 protein [Rosellinia necatrix]